MAKKHKCPECPAGEKWAVPYADFLSLLLALFIALWAISNTEENKVKAFKESFIEIFDYPITTPIEDPRESGQGDEEGASQTESAEALQNDANNVIPSDVDDIGGVLEQMDSGTYLRLPARILFERGQAGITNSDNFTYLDRLASVIKKYPNHVQIDVRGYTDNSTPPIGSGFKDNFELSSARALNVRRELIQKGIEADRIFISAFGQNENAFPNDTPENRAQNNRVEILFFINKANVPEVKSLLEKETGL